MKLTKYYRKFVYKFTSINIKTVFPHVILFAKKEEDTMNEELKCEIGLLVKYIDEFSWLCTYVYYGAQAQKDENYTVFAAIASIANNLAVIARQLEEKF